MTTPGADTPAPPVTDSERGGLVEALGRIPDPRNPHGTRDPLTALLTVAVCAVLAGATSFAAIIDWLYDLDEPAQGRLGFTRGVPAGTTMWRLLTRLDAALLSAALAGWLRSRTPPPPARPRRYRTVIAVDGKTLRGARLPEGRQVHLLSALDTLYLPKMHPCWSDGVLGGGVIMAALVVTSPESSSSVTARGC